MAAWLKGFGRRPFADGCASTGAGVRKPRKEETAGRKRGLFGRARPMVILGSLELLVPVYLRAIVDFVAKVEARERA